MLALLPGCSGPGDINGDGTRMKISANARKEEWGGRRERGGEGFINPCQVARKTRSSL